MGDLINELKGRADLMRDRWLQAESERVAAVERAEAAEVEISSLRAVWAVLRENRDEARAQLVASCESLEAQRSAKAQAELRWQAAEKECAELRARLCQS